MTKERKRPAVPAPRGDGAAPAPRTPVSWFVELQRSPTLTIMSGLGVIMGLLVIAGALPPYFVIPAAALLAVVGAGEVRPIIAERRLARTGRVAPGVVTRLDPVKPIRKHPLEAKWTVAYRYDVDGRAHRGASRPLPWPVLKDLEVGDAIAIHVDRANAERSTWIAGGHSAADRGG